jgi:uncharacterized membrane protein YhaH (DUF805 family)
MNTTNITDFDSHLRPFGDLPKSVNGDAKFAVFASAAGVTTLVLLHWVFEIVGMVRKYKQITERSQRNNFLCIIFSQVTLLMGLISVAAATREYPAEQPLWGQSFSYICVLGQLFLFLPALFVKPLHAAKQAINITHKFSAETIGMVIILLLAVAGVGLEIAVLVTGHDKVSKVPKGLLYSIFSFELATLVISLGLGLYSIKETHNRTKSKEGKDKESNEAFNQAPDQMLRNSYLVAGVAAVALYVVFNSLESPQSLIMRGMEVVSLFIILLVEFFFTWSLVKTVSQIELKIGGKADANLEQGHNFVY